MSQQDQKSQRSDRSHPLELALGGLGGLLVLAALVFLVHQAVAVRERPPLLHAEVVGLRTDQWDTDEHVVSFEVTNDGGLTAEGVRVVGELSRNGRIVEQVSSTIPYVPVESRRAGALVFSEDPRSGTLTIRAVAYNRP